MLSSRASMPTTQLSVKLTAASASRRADCQEVVGHHRVEHVQLEMPAGAGERDGGVIAEHLRAHHRQRFALRRVHLARHDRRARLVFRQHQLAEARARAGAQEADVVGDLEQRRRHRVDARRARTPWRRAPASASNLFGARDEGQLRDRRDLLGDLLGEADRRVEAGADRRAALRQLIRARHAFLHAGDWPLSTCCT